MSCRSILALDVGDRRIGLALSRPPNLLAHPLLTIHRKTLHADLKSLARLIRRYEITALLIGNPLHADGSPSPQTAKTLAFAQSLFTAHPTLQHHILDERLTTHSAHALLDHQGRRQTAADRIQRKNQIDQIAATLLLQAFLDREHGPALLPDPDALRPDIPEGP